MNSLVKDDIFRRALIDLLAPQACAVEFSMNTYIQQGKPRRSSPPELRHLRMFANSLLPVFAYFRCRANNAESANYLLERSTIRSLR
jgi:hypothetical protein